MNRRHFCIIGVILILLAILRFSYVYQNNTDLIVLTNILKNELRSRTKELIYEKSQKEKRAKPPTGMWTVNANGRLGNLMGEYATLFSLAKMNSRQAYILPEMHNPLSKLFKINLPVLHQDTVGRIKWKHYRVHDWMSEEYRHIVEEYVQLRGVLYSYTFYHHIRDEIFHEFTFHDFIIEESYAYLNKVCGDRKNVTFVGVHVRRGDAVYYMDHEWRGVVADKGYLQKATDYFRKKYDNPLFIVTSNGMDWCKENINNSRGDVHFAGDGKEGSPGRDFALLVHCNHTIMTIGTFGHWASYLAGGETIYLANYTLPDSLLSRYLKYEAAFLPNWIGIPADLSPIMNKTKFQ